MDDYPSNSRRSRVNLSMESDIDPRVRKVMTGSDDPRPEKIFSFGREEQDTLITYAIKEVLIPMFKKTVMDIGMNALNLLVYQNLKGSDSQRESGKIISYSRFSDDRYNRDRDDSKDNIRHRPLRVIQLSKRSHAEELINRILDILDQPDSNGCFSAGELYDQLQDMFKDENWVAPPTYYSWGWKGIDKVKLVFTGDCYELRFPRPVYID